MSRPRCAACQRPESHCLCALVPRLSSATRLLILQHPDETQHALNTARLAALGLVNSELLVGEQFEGLEARWEGYTPWLLFPDEQAESLEHIKAKAEHSGKTMLVIPDGTWRKARKLLYLNPCVAALPRVSLPAGLSSRYRLRKAPAAGAVSTIEAIVTTLNILEMPKRFDALLAPFERLIERQIEAMGKEVFAKNHALKRHHH
ncbi:tRNA-uridine aminocarboxypropyltransferase [Pseudomonas luteola]|uniref:tRNA-uridine aminocarboxypropyltransferase n=1 Tax=Pseudomonas luteola TaxID=47886 RepID=UPI00123A1ADC|nr:MULTISPECIES: DTW domain-containing protein [Pseudomonas]MBA1250027.1 DTW domain-containing protein [Pseudomonas zeshuii]QEU28684.1 DTW domain-containing protein [Pseudomonas luteola]